MRRLIITFTLLLFVASSFAGSINFTAKCSHKTVEVGQQFRVTYSVNASGGNFTPPSFEGFNSYGSGQSSNTQIVNGKRTIMNSISYILVATKTGNLKIEPAVFEYEGESYKSNPLKVEVVGADENSANAQRNRQNNRKGAAKELEDYIFIQPVVDKRSAYVGESITVTFKLYYQLNFGQLSPDKMPDYSGFWSKDISPTNRQDLPIERINGEQYQVVIVQKMLLTPQRAGDLEIGSMELNTVVQVKTQAGRNMFDRMRGYGVQNKEVRLVSKPIKITAKALPNKGKPTNFSGAVGQFNMSFKPNKTEVKSNEAIDFVVKISGNGNLPLIAAPKLNFPSDFEKYDPETKNNFKTNAGGSQGSKSFTYLAIPRHSGTFEIEPYTFNYFDPISKSYKEIGHEPIVIQVEKGADEENVVFTPRNKEEVELIGTDIRYLHINGVSLNSSKDRFYQSTLFYLLILLGLGSIGILFFLSRKLKEKSADTVGLKKSKANKLAKKRMAKAKKHLDANETAAFYEEISAALFGYYSDKFNISLAELSQEKIVELIDNKEIGNELKLVLDEAEMARFAPSAGGSPSDLYQKAISVISKTEGIA